MQKYREVLCPICNKKYMWRTTSEQDTHFVDGEGRRIAVMSKCTKCSSELAVFEGKLEAAMIENLDERLKRVKEYGI